MLTLTAGFSFRIGKVGWKRVVDANPYIRQNDWLIDYANSLAESNRRFASQHEKDTRTLVELKNILEIEGLLDRSSHLFENDNDKFATFPHNDYSGLNSLRARLKNKDWDGHSPLIDKDTAKSGKKTVRDKANTIREQLVTLTPFNTIMSWGVSKFSATVYKDMPALTFKVNGRLHKRSIIIALNGADYYEVYLQSGKETTLINGEVCFDELGNVIDEYIERGKDREECNQFCRQQLSKLAENTML